MQRVYQLISILLLIAFGGSSLLFAETQTSANGPSKFALPHFRHFDPQSPTPQKLPEQTLSILADEDFAPFSFRNADGSMAGISIELALAACGKIQVKCQFVPKPYDALLPALDKKQAVAIVGGPAATESLLRQFDFTRPYYASAGQFLVRIAATMQRPVVKSLSGKKLGFVKGTRQQKFLEKYFSHATLTPFETEDAMLNALRIGALDAVFTDSLRAEFWLKGSDARGCCVALGGPMTDRTGLSQGLAMIVDRSRPDITAAFDWALDQLDQKSETAKIFARYLPK